jgi:Aldos-2-ulose dehydratase, beta-propeller domain/FG-GAP-like repeat/FG-GAP repeat
MKWRAHTVGRIPQGYQVAVADVDGDGRLDILALSSEQNMVDWYQNSSWRARSITTSTEKNISLAPLFRPGYPARGLALASGFNLNHAEDGGEIWWARPGASLDTEWTVTLIGRIPGAHRLRWADLDGDGRMELVVVPIVGAGSRPPDYSVPARLSWFEMPEALMAGHAESAGREPNQWTPHLIDDTLNIVHGVHVMDWNGDGRDEILTASTQGVNLFQSKGRGANLNWTRTLLTRGDPGPGCYHGASEIGVGKVHGRRFLATIEPWHGDNVVVYPQAKNGFSQRHVIDSSFKNGHALVCADLDGDGNDEIVAGYRGPGTSLFIYHAKDKNGIDWERETLDTEMATSCLAIADVNDDGRPDIVAVGSSTANVKWYENLGS